MPFLDVLSGYCWLYPSSHVAYCDHVVTSDTYSLRLPLLLRISCHNLFVFHSDIGLNVSTTVQSIAKTIYRNFQVRLFADYKVFKPSPSWLLAQIDRKQQEQYSFLPVVTMIAMITPHCPVCDLIYSVVVCQELHIFLKMFFSHIVAGNFL